MQGLPDKLTFGVEEVAKLIGLGRNSVYELVRRGELKAVPVGSRRIITRHALAEFRGPPLSWMSVRSGQAHGEKVRVEAERQEVWPWGR